MTEILVISGLVAIAYYLKKNQNPLQQQANSNAKGVGIIRNYAYVSEHTGIRIFRDVANDHIPTYGYGRGEIATVPYRTYLGKTTGNFKNGMLEITTNINTKNVTFWADAKKVSLMSKEEYDMRKSDELIEKTDDLIRKLLKL